MKALTLTQPWASLVAFGAKSIETRSWRTEYRGRIAIHAAKGFPDDARYFVSASPFQETLSAAMGLSPVLASALPIASIIAVATLKDCFKFDARTAMLIEGRAITGRLPDHELAFGDYSPGRFGFVLADVVALREPVPARGMLNLWNIPHDVEAKITAQLAEMGVAA
ncbi:MAG: hypothetical protein JWM41_2856 [Gemmatimonadetes bacterium]|nr:hypothetical protein [Gemmatimonadota bacterium]